MFRVLNLDIKIGREVNHIVLLALLCSQLTVIIGAKSDQILLEDVKVLTLHHGKSTNYRRSSAVPQLKCTGGTAGCNAFIPQTVQCYNRGSDGYDVQWECKTDMDNAYRFGKVQVSCEGYNYPDDPYILKGSCGLEYTLDLTKEGYEQKNAGGHHYGDSYGDNYHDRSQYQHGYTKKASSVFQDLIYLGIFAGIIYIVYKTCIAGSNQTNPDAPPSYDDTFRDRGNQQPPPYGFRQDYMPNNGGSCSSGANYTNSQTYTPPGSNTQGGFWSGAFTGGLMGYLLGRNNTYTHTHHRPYTGWWGSRPGWGSNWGTGWGNNWGSGWGTGSSGWGSRSPPRTHTSSGFSSAPRSSGTRTASGFGGTTRR